MAEIAITVKDLVLRYRYLNNYSIKHQLLNFRKNRKNGKGKKGTFEALKGISFEVEKGEILGIIGKNGSGKSTLLRCLAGIFSPDEGSIDLHGHDVSLLAIGVGFKKELTGRENIYLSGMLLGFEQEYIEEKIDDIIAFAGLGEFIDLPVRTYSSGMHSKLAFSITAILEADIMLIDEVLSVGDQKFKKKSYKKMKSLISNKERTVIIVSHSIKSMKELCTKIMWLHEGEIKEIGDTEEVLAHYEAFMDEDDPAEAEARRKKEQKEAIKAATKKAIKEALKKAEESGEQAAVEEAVNHAVADIREQTGSTQ